MAVNEKVELATFAGGCFWCMVSPFEEMEGIIQVISGYTGGHKEVQRIKKCAQKQQDIMKRYKLHLMQIKCRMRNC